MYYFAEITISKMCLVVMVFEIPGDSNFWISRLKKLASSCEKRLEAEKTSNLFHSGVRSYKK